jgi:hypothetical protein
MSKKKIVVLVALALVVLFAVVNVRVGVAPVQRVYATDAELLNYCLSHPPTVTTQTSPVQVECKTFLQDYTSRPVIGHMYWANVCRWPLSGGVRYAVFRTNDGQLSFDPPRDASHFGACK